MSEDNFTDLICRIYSSVEESGDWRVILEEIRQTLDAHLVFAGRLDTNITSPEYTEMVGPERSSLGDALDLHRDELYKIDPGFRYVISKPEGGNFEFLNNEIGNTSDSDDRSEWKSFINSELGSVDYHSRYSPLTDGLNFCLAVHNDRDRGAISSLQREQHRLIFAHMSNAVRLKARPQFLLDENRATVLIDARYRVRKATARAEEIFGTGDGVGVFNHSLKCANGDADIRLNKALARSLSATLIGSFGGGILAERPSGNLPYILTVSPVLEPFAASEIFGPLARVEIVDQGYRRERLSVKKLSDIFGLTPREADVAARFSGRLQNLREIAEEIGISHETARVHLRNIVAKCRVRNQLELVQLLARIS